MAVHTVENPELDAMFRLQGWRELRDQLLKPVEPRHGYTKRHAKIPDDAWMLVQVKLPTLRPEGCLLAISYQHTVTDLIEAMHEHCHLENDDRWLLPWRGRTIVGPERNLAFVQEWIADGYALADDVRLAEIVVGHTQRLAFFWKQNYNYGVDVLLLDRKLDPNRLESTERPQLVSYFGKLADAYVDMPAC